jgi:surfeit locus 1 family protein
MARVTFKPELVPTLAAAAGALVTALLGNWQLNRTADKAELQLRIEHASVQPPLHIGAAPVNAMDVDYFRVEASGEFKPDGTVFVDNRVHKGVPGYEVITPLRIDASERYVLVKRGWIQAGPSRSQLPKVTTPAGVVTVEGVALPGNPRLFELSTQVQSGPLWENVTVDRHRKAFNLQLQPIVIQQHSDLGDGLVREWSRPETGVDRHRAYALQWFGLCAAIIVIYVALNVRRAPHGQRPA